MSFNLFKEKKKNFETVILQVCLNDVKYPDKQLTWLFYCLSKTFQ